MQNKGSIILLSVIIVLTLPRVIFTIYTLCQSDVHHFLCMGNSTGCGKVGHIGLFWGVIQDIIYIIIYGCGCILILLGILENLTFIKMSKLIFQYVIGYSVLAIPVIGFVSVDLQHSLMVMPKLLFVSYIWQIIQICICFILNVGCLIAYRPKY